jgi:dihydrolipoamide dehydrogenase
MLPFISQNDPRVVDSTGALHLHGVPRRLLALGGGIIGLEMATIYHPLGAKVTVAELMDQLILGVDRDLVTPLTKRVTQTLREHLPQDEGDERRGPARGSPSFFDGAKVPATDTFDRILIAMGRRPNGKLIGAENADVAVDDRGFVPVDKELRSPTCTCQNRDGRVQCRSVRTSSPRRPRTWWRGCACGAVRCRRRRC